MHGLYIVHYLVNIRFFKWKNVPKNLFLLNVLSCMFLWQHDNFCIDCYYLKIFSTDTLFKENFLFFYMLTIIYHKINENNLTNVVASCGGHRERVKPVVAEVILV